MRVWPCGLSRRNRAKCVRFLLQTDPTSRSSTWLIISEMWNHEGLQCAASLREGGGIELSSKKYWFFSRFKVNLSIHKMMEIMLALTACATMPMIFLLAAFHHSSPLSPTSSLLLTTGVLLLPELGTSDSTAWKVQRRYYLRLITCWRFWWRINDLWN